MKKNIRLMRPDLLSLMTLFIILPFAAAAQRPLAEVNFDSWFDNREYKSQLEPDQTLFGLKLNLQVGLEWHRDNALMVGTDVWADFGEKPDQRRQSELIVYYRYNSEKFAAYAGVLPRAKLIGNYPAVIVSDSLRHYDSNMEGALFNYRGRNGFVELGCDWLSMISDDQREKFQVLSSGWIQTNSEKFFAGYWLSLFHYSHSYTEEGVVDNFLAYPYVGLDLKKIFASGFFQALSFRAGWIQAMQNDRKNVGKYVTPGGFEGDFYVEKWNVFLRNTLYAGGDLMPYYDRYSTDLYTGEAFYRTQDGIYNRLEVGWNAVRRPDMALRLSSVHHFDGEKWGWQQLIRFSVFLNRGTIGHYGCH